MTTNIREANDLRFLGDEMWESVGNDPFIIFSWGWIRKPHVVFVLEQVEGSLEPTIHIDDGSGYCQENTLCFPETRCLVLSVTVGRFGPLRPLRLDPATGPCRFRITARALSTRKERDAHLEGVKAQKPEAFFSGLPLLPHLGGAILSPPPSARAYLKKTFFLAKQMPVFPVGDKDCPWLSLVTPVYNTPVAYLDALLSSFLGQTQKGVELVLSDDGSSSKATRTWLEEQVKTERLRVVFNDANRGIAVATNAGLAVAQGTWVTFLDQGDLIAPHTFNVIRHALEKNPQALFLYTDEVRISHGKKLVYGPPLLKPAYDPVLLSGVNYINHFSLYRLDRLRGIGFLREGFDGSQDYDLLLRYLEGVPEDRVSHLPYPAYLWRSSNKPLSRQSLEQATQNARKALANRYETVGQPAKVGPALSRDLHRVVFQDEGKPWPLVSILLPSRDKFDLISRILEDLFERTDYPAFEVIVIDNGSTQPDVLDLYDRYRRERDNFSASIEDRPFNYAFAINKGVSLARGDILLSLNNDIQVMDPGWLKEMVSCLSCEGTGIVGAKLLYPNDTIQHAGVIVGIRKRASHWHLKQPALFAGPMKRLHVRNTLTCVTGAALLFTRDCFQTVGPWDEENFAVAFNDVDFCLRAYYAGIRIVWTPFACLYHHESASRGRDDTRVNQPRFEREKAALLNRHRTDIFMDPALNPTYDRTTARLRLALPTCLPSSQIFFGKGRQDPPHRKYD